MSEGSDAPERRAANDRRRSRRRLGTGVAAFVVVAGAFTVGVMWLAASPTDAPASRTPPVPATATASLDAYVAKQAAQAEAAAAQAEQTGPLVSVHSVPVEDDGTIVAVAAFSYSSTGHPVQVLSYTAGQWFLAAALGPDLGPPGQPLGHAYLFALAPGSPVSVADVTGDGRPDFLIIAQAADNDPGVVVSQEGGTWRYVPHSGPYPRSDVVSRNPRFQDGKSSPPISIAIPIARVGASTPSHGPTSPPRVASRRPTLPETREILTACPWIAYR